jgi:hypothetical protein
MSCILCDTASDAQWMMVKSDSLPLNWNMRSVTLARKKCKRFLFVRNKSKSRCTGTREGRELTKQTSLVPRWCGDVDGPPLCGDGVPRLQIGKGNCAVRRAHGQNRAGAGAILTRRSPRGGERWCPPPSETCGQIRGFGLQRLEGVKTKKRLIWLFLFCSPHVNGPNSRRPWARIYKAHNLSLQANNTW